MNMNLFTTRRTHAGSRFIRAGVFWLLAVEGACLSVLYLAALGYGLVTRNDQLAQFWQHSPIFLVAFSALTLASLGATARQISRRAWTRLPGPLLALITVGGGLLFHQTFLAFPAPLVTPYRLLMALTALALAIYFAPSLREQSSGGVAVSPGQVEESAAGRAFPSAGTASRCGRCGRPNPRHLVSLQDGSQPTHLCGECYQEVIRPNTAFQEYRPR